MSRKREETEREERASLFFYTLYTQAAWLSLAVSLNETKKARTTEALAG